MRSDKKHCIIHHSVILGFEWGCSDWMGLWVGFVGKEGSAVCGGGKVKWASGDGKDGHYVFKKFHFLSPPSHTDCIS